MALASRYYREGADEIAFLNITSFRQGVIEDMPMLQVLEEASKCIFVPLTVGGGIRSYEDKESGKKYSALEVASRYFRAGADKVRVALLYCIDWFWFFCIFACMNGLGRGIIFSCTLTEE